MDQDQHSSARAITQATYDRIAPLYDERRAGATALIPALERFEQLLPDGARVLDVGCGTGRDVLHLQTRVAFVMGIDVSTSMLTIAKSKGAQRIVAADFLHLPTSDEVVDGCWAAASLLHAPKARAPDVVAEIRRVLRPNGAFFLCLKEGTGEGIRGGEGEKRYFSLYEQAEGDELLAGAGFEILDTWRTDDIKNPEPWLNWLARKDL